MRLIFLLIPILAIPVVYGHVQPCATGWTHHRQSCFKLFEISKIWYRARDYCVLSQNAHLATSNDKETTDFLKTTYAVPHMNIGDIWIGLNDIAKEGQYEWVGSRQLTNFTDWYVGDDIIEPDNSGNQDCVKVWSSHRNQWDDAACTEMLHFICQKPAVSTTPCGGRFSTKYDKGLLNSPNYPTHYGNDQLCKWTINVREGFVIRLVFYPPFVLESDAGCNKDFVKVFDIASNQQRTLRGIWCGDKLPPEIVSSSSQIEVQFVSDQSNVHLGFSAFWMEVVKPCHSVQEGEGGTLVIPHNLKEHVKDIMDCTWDIRVLSGLFIELKFNSTTADNVNTDGESCENVNIEILDELDDDSLASRGRWCWSNAPAVVKSLGSRLIVNLQTEVDNSTITDVIASWKAVKDCDGKFDSKEGHIMSYDYLKENQSFSTFFSNLSCHWEINVPDGFHINLMFHPLADFDQCGYIKILDFLRGGNSSSPRINWCQGQSKHQNYISTSHKVMVIYNPSDSSPGFKASWTAVCGEVLFGNTGRFSSPNYDQAYPANLDCEWTIKGEINHRVHLYFDSTFDIENTNDHKCAFDYLEVFDSMLNGSLVKRGKYCGNETPSTIVSSTRSMVIRFHSDLNKSGKGFAVSWDTACGEVYDSNNGDILSPNFPMSYPNNFDCRWEIKVDRGLEIKLSFKSLFSVEDYGGCRADYLELFDQFENGSLVSKGRFCGTDIPSPQNSATSMMVLVFHTDQIKNGAGFHAVWQSVCGAVYKTDNGFFTSPGFPHNYPDNIDCRWDIHATPGHHVRLQFDSTFALELSSENCEYDNVEVLDYFSNGTAISNGRWCGLRKLPIFVSTGSHITVLFHSDVDKTANGFNATWDTVTNCGGTFITESGHLMSPNYSSKYPSHLFCHWEINPPAGSNVTLQFDQLFDIETDKDCAWDYLEIVRGTETIGRWCGTGQPPPIQSIGETLIVEFKSDRSNNGRGFFASWTSS